jgi:hypothetical protein
MAYYLMTQFLRKKSAPGSALARGGTIFCAQIFEESPARPHALAEREPGHQRGHAC